MTIEAIPEDFKLDSPKSDYKNTNRLDTAVGSAKIEVLEDCRKPSVRLS